MKIFYGIVSIILVVVALSVPAFRSWVINLYTVIANLNNNFFAVMPTWFNFLIGTLVISILIRIALSFRS